MVIKIVNLIIIIVIVGKLRYICVILNACLKGEQNFSAYTVKVFVSWILPV